MAINLRCARYLQDKVSCKKDHLCRWSDTCVSGRMIGFSSFAQSAEQILSGKPSISIDINDNSYSDIKKKAYGRLRCAKIFNDPASCRADSLCRIDDKVICKTSRLFYFLTLKINPWDILPTEVDLQPDQKPQVAAPVQPAPVQAVTQPPVQTLAQPPVQAVHGPFRIVPFPTESKPISSSPVSENVPPFVNGTVV